MDGQCHDSSFCGNLLLACTEKQFHGCAFCNYGGGHQRFGTAVGTYHDDSPVPMAYCAVLCACIDSVESEYKNNYEESEGEFL